LALFAWRASSLKPGGIFAPVSRESGLVLNNLLLTTACATVLVGTLYPLALEALTGEKISVGAPFFNATFIPLFIPLFIVMPFGQMLAWKRGNLLGAAQRLFVAMACGLAAMLAFAAWRGGPVVSVILAGLAVFACVGAFTDLIAKIFGRGGPNASAWIRILHLPRSVFGTAFAHAGLAVTLLGLAATGWGQEKILAVKPGETIEIGSYELVFESLATRPGPNYTARVAEVKIREGGVELGAIEPANRFYPSRQMNRAEAGIKTLGLGQIYVSIAEETKDGSISARIFWKPLVALIWIGALIMGFGGALSLSDRRLRIGIARRKQGLAVAATQPAE
jgi:cytochrome c-type biogenesis protein CcmF